ncbi:glycosyltransferase family 4 protein [Neomicrococcus aestuarii]|uniref:D-inositol 3-phosphate glycosyltransferase n=1 Tax=Neomicrococcus aestuarii TaxID=556325 RepID=A0A1L2ZLP5_9MICC|nr:glycosyltransferase family 4 protein [Neomicrococcus aestuarii]APF39938.1 hypothetical protein BHE16_01660 [Neomicrococcus aestuarii]
MVRLLLITHSYSPESTAPQRRWSSFIQHFRGKEWNVSVIAPQPDDRHVPRNKQSQRSAVSVKAKLSFTAERGAHGEQILRVPLLALSESRVGRFAGNVLSAGLMIPRAALNAALHAEKPDVVIVTVPALPSLVTGYLISVALHRPLIVDMRDAWPDLAREAQLKQEGLVRLLEFVVHSIQSRAAAIVTVTEGFRDILVHRGMKSVRHIPNGISETRLRELTSVERASYGAEPLERPLHVLYMGNHGESQALELIIDAAKLAGPAVSLRFVGSGTQKDALTEYARGLGVDAEFLPVVFGDEAAAQYEWADTCVVSLRDDWESFKWTIPSKTFELLATGRHITGVVQGEAALLLAKNVNATVVPADPAAVASLWSELRANPASMNTASGDRFGALQSITFESVAQEYVDVVEHVVRTSRAGRTTILNSKDRS